MWRLDSVIQRRNFLIALLVFGSFFLGLLVGWQDISQLRITSTTVSRPVETVEVFHETSLRPHRILNQTRIPLILAWSPFYRGSMIEKLLQPNVERCPFKCSLTDAKKMVSKADAILFHSRESLSFPDPGTRRREQLYVVLEWESPANMDYYQWKVGRYYYNASMNYRKDADYSAPYGRFELTNDPNKRWREPEIETAYAAKKNLAFALISNCAKHYVKSGRAEYIEELSKYMPIEKAGGCYGKKCDNRCEKNLEETSFFVLAFENTVCDDYVTEKFWRLKRLVVPVVLRRSVVRAVAPGDTFIAADDFASPKELAAFLKATAADKQQYLRYFEWTKRYAKEHSRVHSDFARDAYCDLCFDLNFPGTRSRRNHDDFFSWWNASTQCYHNYGLSLLPKMQQ